MFQPKHVQRYKILMHAEGDPYALEHVKAVKQITSCVLRMVVLRSPSEIIFNVKIKFKVTFL